MVFENDDGTGVGRHYSDHFMDPTLVRPDISGQHYRTTLVNNGDAWFVLELCEPLESIVDPGASFYELEGSRDVITILTGAEKDPGVMGFALEGDDNELQGQAEGDGEQIDVEILALEDDVEIEGQDIDQGDAGVGLQGVDIQEQIMVAPAPEDKIAVNGVELTALSTLALLRQALTFYSFQLQVGRSNTATS